MIVTTITLAVFAWNKHQLAGVEGEIYWSVMNVIFPESKYLENVAFISKVTTCENPEYVRNRVPSVVTDNFIQANGPSGTPLRLSFFEGKVQIANWKSTKEVHNPNGARSIPEGKEVVAISRAGLNQERNKALICLKNLKGHYHSRSAFFYLEKKNGSWKVVNDYSI